MAPEARARREAASTRAPGAALAAGEAEVPPQEVALPPRPTADRGERERLLTVGAVAGAAVAGVAVTRAARRRSR
jgi:hypothetical protein